MAAAVAARPSLDEETIERLCNQINQRYPNEEDVTDLAVAMSMATFGEQQETQNIRCVACEDRHSLKKVFYPAPCGHNYCIACVEELHRSAMQDETLYPPRCCQQEMPWGSVRLIVDDELEADFEEKREELSTKNRTYCHKANCSAFISGVHIAGNIATCPECHDTTCAICKAASHAGDCPADEEIERTLNLAENQGWRRCGECRKVIELVLGCNHIT